MPLGVGFARTVAAAEDDLVVLVGEPDGCLVMVAENDIIPVLEPLPATPIPATPSATVPATLDDAVTEGRVDYWLTDGAAFVFRLDTGAAASWWWLPDGGRSRRLPLLADLEPALPSGSEARWFHGATVDAEHLGSGTLRLLAVEVATGEVILDQQRDRRLELAATTVTPDGAVVAHAQGLPGGVELWAADLRSATIHESGSFDPAVTVAPSGIHLLAATTGDRISVAAGLTWSRPEDPAPQVAIARYPSSTMSGIATLDGELVGIVPATSVERDPRS